jgi:exodeoxyribonuclease VII small subunit
MSIDPKPSCFHSRSAVDRELAANPQYAAVAKPAKETETLGFDDVIERLRAVVGRLEEGKLSLEESLQAYEQGVGLARRGHALLDDVEKRVEVLVKGAAGDSIEPLDGDGGGDS